MTTKNTTFSDLDEVDVAVDRWILAVERDELEYGGSGRRSAAVERPDALVARLVVDGVVGEIRRGDQRRPGCRTLGASAH